MAGLLYIYTYEDCDCYGPCGPCGPCSGNCYYEDDIIVIPTASQSKSFFDKCKNIFGRKVPDTFCERLTSYNTKIEKLQEVQESQNIINQKWMPIPEDKIYKVGNSSFCSTPTKPPRKFETTKL